LDYYFDFEWRRLLLSYLLVVSMYLLLILNMQHGKH
jgi:hypothetical protein